MRTLENLNAGKNEISTIFHDTFYGPKNIRRLILSNDNINYIEDKSFFDLGYLESLDLEKSLLGSLYEDWFVGLHSIFFIKFISQTSAQYTSKCVQTFDFFRKAFSIRK